MGLPVLSRKVDIANVRVEFDSGCIANFTASRVSTEQVRKLRFFQPRQYLSLDFARQELLTIEVSAAAAAAASMGGAALEALAKAAAASRAAISAATSSTGGSSEPALKGTGFSPSVTEAKAGAALAAEGASAHPSAGLNLKKYTVGKSEPLRLELENFLTAVRKRTTPRVTGSQGRAALALALDINAAIAAHAQRAGL